MLLYYFSCWVRFECKCFLNFGSVFLLLSLISIGLLPSTSGTNIDSVRYAWGCEASYFFIGEWINLVPSCVNPSGLIVNYRIYSSISRIFLYQNITQKVRCDLYTNTWSALYAIQNFLRCFLAMHFYAVSFRMIISLIAFHASSVALLTLSPFFHILTCLVITYP